MARRRLLSVVVPVSTFVVGLIVKLAFDKLNGTFVETIQALTLVSLAGVGVIMVTFSIVLTVMVQETRDSQSAIEHRIDEITRKYGLTAEFIDDGDGDAGGITYERTRELIEDARSSLVFVDLWTQIGDYLGGKTIARERREAYYRAISEQVTRHRDYRGDKQFHRRIIQIPNLTSGIDLSFFADHILSEHLRTCLEIQEVAPRASVIRLAPPYIHTVFAVIV